MRWLSLGRALVQKFRGPRALRRYSCSWEKHCNTWSHGLRSPVWQASVTETPAGRVAWWLEASPDFLWQIISALSTRVFQMVEWNTHFPKDHVLHCTALVSTNLYSQAAVVTPGYLRSRWLCGSAVTWEHLLYHRKTVNNLLQRRYIVFSCLGVSCKGALTVWWFITAL